MSTPRLHVEVLLKDIESDVYISRDTIEDEVQDHLKNTYRLPVCDGQLLDMTGFKHVDQIESVKVTGVDLFTRNMNSCFELANTQLHVHAFMCRGLGGANATTFALPSSTNAQARIMNLPHEALTDVWERLEFDETQSLDPEQVLRAIVRTVNLLSQRVDSFQAINVNRLILFHGPPGCGKSTLCRALAQKLTIRLSRTFRSGKLFEINTQDLLSKYYSESGKLVCEMFDKVLNMAQDGKELICVLIDEIESIAASRQHSTRSGECSDTLRATNQLLTALDRVKSKPNIVVFCTSNLLEAIDAAFLDRLYDAIAVPPPCAAAVYTILSNTLNNLIKAEAIVHEPWPLNEEDEMIGELVEYRTRLPSYGPLMTWEASYADSPGPRLNKIAHSCAGLSGRRLRKLPFLAITKYTLDEPCSIHDAITALEKAAEFELAS